MRLVAVALVVLLVAGAVPPSAASRGPRIVAAYPNPVATDDVGEFVVVVDAGNLTLGDGESSVRVPDRDDAVALSTRPEVTRNLTDRPVVGVDLPRLSNAGETLTLARGGETLASVTYVDAPEASVRRWAASGARDAGWRPLGATDRPVVHTDGGRATVFVLPDVPGPPVESLRRADDRILLAGYTFGSERVTRALVAARERGVRVRVLVDGGPVGGLSSREARLLDRLAAAGVEVRVLDGPYARYRFHHAKYAVVDDRALVLTENWKPAGIGGHSSRGWGVRLRDAETARALAATFRADAGGRDAVAWVRFRARASFQRMEPADETYPSRFPTEQLRVRNASVLVAPDNAERGILRRIDAADESLRVLQVSVGSRRQPFLQAALRAARRGVEVRVLLSGAWYVEDENRRLIEWLNVRSRRENLPLSARLAVPGGRFEKVHAKGVVVDDETVLVGSLNWNNVSARENREVVLALESDGAARYFGRVFDADWRRSGAGGERLPVGLLVVVLLGAVVALLAARRVEFE